MSQFKAFVPKKILNIRIEDIKSIIMITDFYNSCTQFHRERMNPQNEHNFYWLRVINFSDNHIPDIFKNTFNLNVNNTFISNVINNKYYNDYCVLNSFIKIMLGTYNFFPDINLLEIYGKIRNDIGDQYESMTEHHCQQKKDDYFLACFFYELFHNYLSLALNFFQEKNGNFELEIKSIQICRTRVELIKLDIINHLENWRSGVNSYMSSLAKPLNSF
jgi:hypothetical protein